MAIDFNRLEPPYLHIVVTNEKMFGDYAYKTNFEERSLAVRVVRGKKMRQRESFFNEISAALQFPLYFGENWDALDESLADLGWLRGEGYILFVVNAIDVLNREPSGQFEIFLQILADIAPEWAKSDTPKPFHVVLHCSDGELDRLQQHFKAAGINTSLLETLPAWNDKSHDGTSA